MDSRCEQWMASHFEVITRRRAVLFGLSRHEIDARLARCEWEIVFPRVYHRAAAPLGPAVTLYAAVAWAGPGAMAGDWSSAWARGLWPHPPPEAHLVVDRRRTAPPPGIAVVRSEHLPRSELVRGIPCAGLADTLVGVAVTAGDDQLSRILDSVMADHAGALLQLLETVGPEGRLRGRRGAARLRRALVEGGYAGSPQSTSGESKLGRIARGAGLPATQREYEVRVGRNLYKLDFAEPEILFAYEFDGYGSHSTPAQRRYDNQRRRDLERIGWTLRTYTWPEVTSGRRRTAAELTADRAAAVARRFRAG